jgi:hypothetical protein
MEPLAYHYPQYAYPYHDLVAQNAARAGSSPNTS